MVAGNITFTNTSSGVPTSPQFAWLYDGLSSSLENPTFTYNASISQVCFAIYSLDTTCEDSICGPVGSPPCSLNISWTSAINGSAIMFYNTSSGMPSNPAFAWLYNGQSSSVENPVFPYDSTVSDVCFAIYDIDLPSCQDSICGPQNDSASCNLDISWTSSVGGGNIIFTNTSTGMPTNPAFAWLYNGQSSSVENPSFPYDSTIFQVCFAIYDIDQPNCEDSICGGLISDSTASYTEELPWQDIKIFPNPTSSDLKIILNDHDSPYLIQVLDVTGRLILSTTMIGAYAELDLSNVEEGGYFLYISDIENPDYFTVKKILKQ